MKHLYGSIPDRITAALNHTGGGVTVGELAYQTGLPERQITVALHDLEVLGLATPFTWTAGSGVS